MLSREFKTHQGPGRQILCAELNVHTLEQKYSWCHGPEFASVGFFLGEQACRVGWLTLQLAVLLL
jgi:hypothetical protein